MANASVTSQETARRADGLTMAGFGATLLLSACLLFVVQPMFARMALPLLGGSPSVWAIAMCFFQGILLAGYAYAHVLRLYVSPAAGLLIHAAVLALATHSLPIEPPQATTALTGLDAGLALLGIFASSLGLPFFAVSATAPLLQSWFALSGHRQAANPYVLYAASNVGSIGALVIYPTLIEPFAGLAKQSELWTTGFALLTVAVTLCGLIPVMSQVAETPQKGAAARAPVSYSTRAYWLILSFIPSALLVAWTNHITADIASAPFIWLPPLILFLLTFVFVFRDKPRISNRAARIMQLAGFPLTYAVSGINSPQIIMLLLLAGAATFLGTALICHRQLYESRPEASRLTEFYLIMSLGGVLGGLFVSLLAPLVFTSVTEFPMLLLAGLLVHREVWSDSLLANWRKQARSATLIYLAFLCLFALARHLYWKGERSPFELALFAVLPFVFVQEGRKALAGSLFAAFILMNLVNIPAPDLAKRNYFGVLTVYDTGKGTRGLKHGTTLHGAQMLAEIDPAYTGMPTPLTYYTPQGGIVRALELAQDRAKITGTKIQAGIVGLGVGSMACYAQPGEGWAMFEIDPHVIDIAMDASRFTFMSRCGRHAKIIVGDARLTLNEWQSGAFDYLLIDAFSSDSIPAHLLTAESVGIYLSKLSKNGLLAFHISNRHMQLESFIIATMHKVAPEMDNRLVRNRNDGGLAGASGSDVLVFSADSDLLASLDQQADVVRLKPQGNDDAWTDDFANLPAAIMAKYFP